MASLYPSRTTVKTLGLLCLLTCLGQNITRKSPSKAYSILHLLHRSFSTDIPILCKHKLYTSLVLPHFIYCSPIWRPHLIKDFQDLESVQRRATKYILGNSSLDYKERLISLKLLPLMYQLELNDILFFVSCLKNPDYNYSLMEHFVFSSAHTRSAASIKLVHSSKSSPTHYHNFISRLPRLWNSLPSVDLSLSFNFIKHSLKDHFYSHFLIHFQPNSPCLFHYSCPCNRCSKLTKINFSTLVS